MPTVSGPESALEKELADIRCSLISSTNVLASYQLCPVEGDDR